MIQVKGLPFKGSKQSIAIDLVNTMLRTKPETKKVYDLFGGGGSIAVEFARRGIEVVYNDIDTATVRLWLRLSDRMNSISGEAYQWVSRKRFNQAKSGNSWWDGFARSVYSFGNNGKDYIYSKENEQVFEAIHKYSMLGDFDSMVFLNVVLSMRLEHGWDVKKTTKHIRDKCIGDLKPFHYIRHIESIKRVLALQDFKGLDLISFNNMDFNQMKITGDRATTIVYLDPTYLGTDGYLHGSDIDLKEFVRKTHYPIFMSEYQDRGIKDFKEIWSKKVSGKLNKNTTTSVEKLFYAR